MSETVHVPGVGATKKKVVIYVAAGAVLLLGVYWYRSRGAAGDTGEEGTSGTIDPATGYVYGSAEDAAALAEQASYISAAGESSVGVGSELGSTSTTLAGPVFSDNHAWSQYASEYLVNVNNKNAAQVSAAMGAYLSGDDVDDAGKSLIEQAIAYAGRPPVAGVGGYPPSIKLTAAPATRNAVNPVQNLRELKRGQTTFTVGWASAPRATSYRVRLDQRAAVEIRGTLFTARNLHKDSKHTVHVLALPAGDNAKSASVTVHTKP